MMLHVSPARVCSIEPVETAASPPRPRLRLCVVLRGGGVGSGGGEGVGPLVVPEKEESFHILYPAPCTPH
eukprot:1172127-Prorocentrum_minimum.AAC.1